MKFKIGEQVTIKGDSWSTKIMHTWISGYERFPIMTIKGFSEKVCKYWMEENNLIWPERMLTSNLDKGIEQRIRDKGW